VIRRFILGAVAIMTVPVGPRAPSASFRAAAQEPAPAKESGVAEDDPFADELNPFGKGKPGKTPAPRGPAAMPPAKQPEDPEPVPEAEPSPEPKPTQRAKSRPKLPVPFPEAPTDDDAVPLRDRFKGRADRTPQPGAMRARSDKTDDDGWLEQDEAEKMLVEAEKLEKDGKFEEARDKLLQVVEKDPSLVVGHLVLGVVLRRLGDFRGSVEACTKGIEIDPQEPELYLRRSIAWFHQGLYGIALEDFEDAAGIAYEDPRPELWRGLTLIELDRPLEAINAYASAIRRDRTCMLAYLNRGLTYLATDEPRKAEFDFNQAIRQKPKDSRAWFNRGVAQAQQGRFNEAIVSYETVLGIEPTNEAARRKLEAARRMAARPAVRAGR
jgi:tetratricopeptide (TPR) repeat protein